MLKTDSKYPFSISPAVLLFLLFWPLIFFLFGQSLLRDGDTAFHIKIGEWMWQHRQLMTTDVFSWLTPAPAYHPHAWLTQILMAWAYHVGQEPAIVWMYSLVLAGTYAYLYSWVRLEAGVGVGLLITGATIFSSYFHWYARPHVFSLLLLLIVLRILSRSGSRLLLLPPLFYLWACLHSGFIVGLITFGISFSATLIMWMMRLKDKKS